MRQHLDKKKTHIEQKQTLEAALTRVVPALRVHYNTQPGNVSHVWTVLYCGHTNLLHKPPRSDRTSHRMPLPPKKSLPRAFFLMLLRLTAVLGHTFTITRSNSPSQATAYSGTVRWRMLTAANCAAILEERQHVQQADTTPKTLNKAIYPWDDYSYDNVRAR